MNSDESSGAETCLVCGKAAESGAAFAHLYHDGHRFPLCCPMCVQMFQRAPERFARGERPQAIVEELLAEMKWKTPDHW